MFIRYWDAACRYILELIDDPGNWDANVDVWGIPHLVVNSLGAWLRVSEAHCPNCDARMYMATWGEIPTELRGQLMNMTMIPISLFICPQCNAGALASTRI